MFFTIFAQAQSFQPWLNWGFWDYFWLTIISSTIIYAYYRAIRNSKKIK